MSTQPPFDVPAGAPSLPLSATVRAAYQDLYDKIEAAIEGTADAAALEALNPMEAQVEDVLTKDAMYRLQANTQLFNALLQQIDETNAGLKKLQGQIAAIASHFAQAGDVLAAIDKVLSLVAGA